MRRVSWVYVDVYINSRILRFDRRPVSPKYSFAASRRGSASALYALLSSNHSSNNTVCWSVPPVLYFFAAARFRFQSPHLLICSSFPVFFFIFLRTPIGGYKGGSFLNWVLQR